MNKLHMIFQAIHLDDKSVYKSQSEQCDSKTVQTFLLFTKFRLLKWLIHIESTAKKWTKQKLYQILINDLMNDEIFVGNSVYFSLQRISDRIRWNEWKIKRFIWNIFYLCHNFFKPKCHEFLE